MSSRLLAAIAVAGQLAFIIAWAVAGLAEPGYSTARQTVSELFSRAAEHPEIMRAGLVALVPSYLAVGVLAIAWFAVAGDSTYGIAQRTMFATVTVSIFVLSVMPAEAARSTSEPRDRVAS